MDAAPATCLLRVHKLSFESSQTSARIQVELVTHAHYGHHQRAAVVSLRACCDARASHGPYRVWKNAYRPSHHRHSSGSASSSSPTREPFRPMIDPPRVPMLRVQSTPTPVPPGRQESAGGHRKRRRTRCSEQPRMFGLSRCQLLVLSNGPRPNGPRRTLLPPREFGQRLLDQRRGLRVESCRAQQPWPSGRRR